MAMPHNRSGSYLIFEVVRPSSRGACIALAFAAASVASGAVAQDYAARDVGGWTVTPSSDGEGCFLTRTYDRPGKTTLLLGLDRDGANHLSVLNGNWSIKPKDRLDLDFRLSRGAYAEHAVIGIASDGQQGFVTSFEAKFPALFATSRMLEIYRGKVPVEKLNLAGSGAAVAELRTCAARGRADDGAAAGKRKRANDIPADPFASDPEK